MIGSRGASAVQTTAPVAIITARMVEPDRIAACCMMSKSWGPCCTAMSKGDIPMAEVTPMSAIWRDRFRPSDAVSLSPLPTPPIWFR
ncbi:hypothetical protein D3C80_1711630 [compost metagenome]